MKPLLTAPPNSTSRVALLLLVLLPVCFAACGKPFNVQPKPTIIAAPPDASATLKATAEANGLQVQAHAITDEDYLYDTFDANLILAGVLPVRLQFGNTRSATVDLSQAKLELVAPNKTYKVIDSHKAYKKLMSYYGIRIYNKHGFKTSRQDFDTYALDLKKALAPHETREGLIYFAVPDALIKSSRLTLLARKLGATQAPGDSTLELLLK
ncbi:MAG: hypothetical protein HY231_12465 [Acidobacteria bacterium]|nr:hypothetical protein [Acidobacteriota bacterium]